LLTAIAILLFSIVQCEINVNAFWKNATFLITVVVNTMLFKQHLSMSIKLNLEEIIKMLKFLNSFKLIV